MSDKMVEIFHEYVHGYLEWSLWETTALLCGIDPKLSMQEYMNSIMEMYDVEHSLGTSRIVINVWNDLRKWGCWNKDKKKVSQFFIINQLIINKISMPDKLLELICKKAKKLNIDYSYNPMIKVEIDKRNF